MSEQKPPMKCPSCGVEFDSGLTAKFLDQYKMTMTLEPDPAVKQLPARAVHQTIESLEQMLTQTAKMLGAKVTVFISDIRTNTDTGAITVSVLVAANKREHGEVGKYAVKEAMRHIKEATK